MLTSSFLFVSFYFSHFTVGDSGNLLCSVAGQKSLERLSRRAAGWCVCVFCCACHIFPSLSIPFAGQQTCVTSLSYLSVSPQVRSAASAPQGLGGSRWDCPSPPPQRACTFRPPLVQWEISLTNENQTPNPACNSSLLGNLRQEDSKFKNCLGNRTNSKLTQAT